MVPMLRAAAVLICSVCLCVVAPAAWAEAAASWSITPESYEFAPRAIGTGPSAPAVFTITNTGTTTIQAPEFSTNVAPGEAEWHDRFDLTSHCESGLAPGESCVIEATFEPTVVGRDTQFVFVSDPENHVGTFDLQLSGAAALPAIRFIPGGLRGEFGVFLPSRLLGIEIRPPSVLVVENPGETALHIFGFGLVELGTNPVNPDGLRILGGTCAPGAAVPVGGSCTVQLTATPTVAGTVQAGIEFADDVPDKAWPIGREKLALVGHQIYPLRIIGVDPTRPSIPEDVAITFGPPAKLHRTWARFRFAVPDAGATFLCRLDAKPYRPCTSPITYRHLALGRHAFRVRPVTPSATVSGRTAVLRFRVTPAPRHRR
jgi:hypothetical protein